MMTFLLALLYLVGSMAASFAFVALAGLALWAGMECLDAIF